MFSIVPVAHLTWADIQSLTKISTGGYVSLYIPRICTDMVYYTAPKGVNT